MYLEALVVAIAAAISVLMASAWVVQQRTGNSGLGRHHLDLFARPGRRQNRVRRRDEIERVLRWFFLATAGLFGYAGGSEWGVSH